MNSTLSSIAERLRESYGGPPIAPVREALEPNDIDAAYEVQNINTEFWLARGRRLAGRKIGLTSEAVQKQLGVDQPDYGMLFADMQVADKGHVAPGRLIQPKVEAEIALVLKDDLAGTDLTVEQLRASVDYLVAAIEIVDSRIEAWRISIVDTIADNASSALYVLGSEKHKPETVDVIDCRMTLSDGDGVVSQGFGRACLGSPYRAALWLARKMAEVGRPLQRGDVVLTGALGPMTDVVAGKSYRAEIEGLGSVGVSF